MEYKCILCLHEFFWCIRDGFRSLLEIYCLGLANDFLKKSHSRKNGSHADSLHLISNWNCHTKIWHSASYISIIFPLKSRWSKSTGLEASACTSVTNIASVWYRLWRKEVTHCTASQQTHFIWSPAIVYSGNEVLWTRLCLSGIMDHKWVIFVMAKKM